MVLGWSPGLLVSFWLDFFLRGGVGRGSEGPGLAVQGAGPGVARGAGAGRGPAAGLGPRAVHDTQHGVFVSAAQEGVAYALDGAAAVS